MSSYPTISDMRLRRRQCHVAKNVAKAVGPQQACLENIITSYSSR